MPYMNRNRVKMRGTFDIHPKSQLKIEICRSLEIFLPIQLELSAILSSMHLELSVVKGLSLDSFLFWSNTASYKLSS